MAAIPPNTPQGLRWQVTPQAQGGIKVEVKAGDSLAEVLPPLTLAPDQAQLGQSGKKAGPSRSGLMFLALLSALSGGLLSYGYRSEIDKGLAHIANAGHKTAQTVKNNAGPVAKLLTPVFNEAGRFARIHADQERDLEILAKGVSTDTSLSDAHLKRLLKFTNQRTVLIQPQAANGQPTKMGSGWIMSEDGVVVTNAHVVEMDGMMKLPNAVTPPSEYVTVALCPDGNQPSEKLFGYVINSDPYSDVAVIQLDTIGRKLPYFPIAPAEGEQGDTIVSSGHALSYPWTATVGRLVGTGDHPNINKHYIQIDAHMGPGASGGPLVNSKGELVGMNTAITNFSETPAHVGLCLSRDKVLQEVRRLRTSKPLPYMELYTEALKNQPPVENLGPSTPLYPRTPYDGVEILPAPEPTPAWPRTPIPETDPFQMKPEPESTPAPPRWESQPKPMEDPFQPRRIPPRVQQPEPTLAPPKGRLIKQTPKSNEAGFQFKR